ncbi:hypothetical protein D3P04_14000 [Paracoccus onubensis]|uniref:Uncharacterized protein n=1 Tax=Paracoccus onubensis TaxID=1675788 RepID=A0A418ST14_9RHOB|nr:hypothetical protein D3P04_14000 [Paracoccus onubensis]
MHDLGSAFGSYRYLQNYHHSCNFRLYFRLKLRLSAIDGLKRDKNLQILPNFSEIYSSMWLLQKVLYSLSGSNRFFVPLGSAFRTALIANFENLGRFVLIRLLAVTCDRNDAHS